VGKLAIITENISNLRYLSQTSLNYSTIKIYITNGNKSKANFDFKHFLFYIEYKMFRIRNQHLFHNIRDFNSKIIREDLQDFNLDKNYTILLTGSKTFRQRCIMILQPKFYYLFEIINYRNECMISNPYNIYSLSLTQFDNVQLTIREYFFNGCGSKDVFIRNQKLMSYNYYNAVHKVINHLNGSLIRYNPKKINTSLKSNKTSLLYFNYYKSNLINQFNKKSKNNNWSVAYSYILNGNDCEALNLTTKVDNSNNTFLADPFCVEYSGKSYLFAEQFDYTKQKGSIATFIINENSYQFLGISLEENYHISYPMVFFYQNTLYMIPETYNAHSIKLFSYKVDDNKWIFIKNLIDNIDAVDTNILIDEKVYLFFSADTLRKHDHNSELFVYSANGLFDDFTFVSSLLDSRISRNAGNFTINSSQEIMRPYQIHKFDFYGKDIGFNKLSFKKNEIILEDYDCDSFIKTYKSSDYSGFHTINKSNLFLCWDYIE